MQKTVCSLYFSLVSATASLLRALSIEVALKFILDTQMLIGLAFNFFHANLINSVSIVIVKEN